MLDYLRELRKSDEEKQQEALCAYLDDALSPQQRQLFEKELAADDVLQTQLNQMRALKQQMRQLPRRQVPRNFTLNPALYGRPAKEPLLRAYPVLRTATVLTAFIFIFALTANIFLNGQTNVASDSAQPLALMSEPNNETFVEEGEPIMDSGNVEEPAEELAEEAVGGVMTLPAEAESAPVFESEEAPLIPPAPIDSDNNLQESSPQDQDIAADVAEESAAPNAESTGIASQLIPQDAPSDLTDNQDQESVTETQARDDAVNRPFSVTSLLLPLLGTAFLLLLTLTLLARRRL